LHDNISFPTRRSSDIMVDQNYVDRKAINYKEMSYQAIRAMLGVLHDTGHTRFLTPQDVKSEKQQLSGKLIGIGINLQQDAKTKRSEEHTSELQSREKI